ncbi:MAG TPA: hypothetical protein VF121_13910 [Thermoanaerobaculia bacterium]|nr:hypothetical protein [Thermoanaerobaculia bacterium]
MASHLEEGGGLHTTGATSVPEDPPKPAAMYALSYTPIRGLSLILLIIAILLCLEEMEIAFVTFMILALAFEVIDLVCGVKYLHQVWSGVTRCVSGWKALQANKHP